MDTDGGLLLFFFLMVSGLLIILLFLYIRCTATFGVLKRNGIQGPTPSFFFGNYKERTKCGGHLEYLKRLHEEYGPIVGTYVGQQANLSILDIELIKLVTVKDFDHFMDRPIYPNIVRLPEGLPFVRGETWRTTRKILSPVFSSFKMKAMSPIIQQSIESLVDLFQSHANEGKSFEILRIYSSFVLNASFQRVIEVRKGQSKQHSCVEEAVVKLAASSKEHRVSAMSFVTMLLSNLPWLEPVIRLFGKASAHQKALNILADASMTVVHERRRENSKHQDILQLFMDASMTKAGGGGERRLSDLEIVDNVTSFMLAGYETTTNALTYTSYLLALHPQVQERLQQEIDDYYEENPDATSYRAAQDLEYMDMVLQESLRIYPPAPLYARLCIKEYKYKDITIPKGAIVNIPSILLHMDPEYWKDPEIFDPLRFTAEEKAKRPQLCHMPFGYGYRKCIAMQFALLEVKMTLSELLRRFRFVRTPETEVPLETAFGITMVPKNGLYLRVVPRDA